MQTALRGLPTDTTRFRLLLLLAGSFLALVGGLGLEDAQGLILVGCSVSILLLVFVYRLDYLHPAVAYVVPWITVLLFSTVPISTLARIAIFNMPVSAGDYSRVAGRDGGRAGHFG